jgi:hypothetical protein
MHNSDNKIPSIVTDELNHLPEAYDGFSTNFRLLVAAMRMLGFTIARADEAIAIVGPDADLRAESGHPSIRIAPHNSYDLRESTKATKPGSPEYLAAMNKSIAANMREQLRLLDLLDGFYDKHTPTSFYARLIAQTNEVGETNLKPQGADVRVILPKEEWQRQLLEESNAEMLMFAHYLCEKIIELDLDKQ